MISAFASLRALAILRRITRALESISRSQETLAQAAADAAAQSVRPAPRRMTVSQFDPRVAQAEYRRRVMEAQGLSDDGEYEEFMGRT